MTATTAKAIVAQAKANTKKAITKAHQAKLVSGAVSYPVIGEARLAVM